MKRNRVRVFAVIILLYFSFGMYKLMDIQLISPETYGPEKVNLLEESVKQRSSQITLSNGRGYFLDRNNQALNRSKTKDVVIFPFVASMKLSPSMEQMLETTSVNWKDKLVQSKKPLYLSELGDIQITNDMYDNVQNESIPGIVAVERTVENDELLASHVVGIVRANSDEFKSRYEESLEYNEQPVGISGLEKAFDPFLLSKDEQKLMYHVDAKGDPLLGLDFRYQGESDPFYPVKVQTTLDLDKQTMLEGIIDKQGITKGGAVLLDVETREVLAMVSRPSFDPKEPYKDNHLSNQMLISHFPGSIFKTVIAAAAIEQSEDSLHKQYDCDKNLYGDSPSDRTLGMLNFEESFAQSCNFTFGSIAIDMMKEDQAIIEKYAEKLGLVHPVGWKGDIFHYNNFKQLPEEESGNIWGDDQDRYVDRAIAQTAIGQKEVKVTPLAIANMMVTIANNGVKGEVKIVDKLLYNNGTTMQEFKPHGQVKDSIKASTAKELQNLLKGVVDNGTGASLNAFPVSGKSGTAETGRENQYHHWFAGYFPTDKPKYALVVVDLDQSSGQAKTYPVYYDSVESLLNHDSFAQN
ncbi:penicillin-binding protein 2 [Aquibacillus koreensis]|uniref:serine-type D-Ala-D-Ala carboxypeptidase n=1 Tax=Aquibacillus koreensis TaxID=279446 RepID=A0A9X3WI97_9BACI|nr:penicillin-binding protein 2 [Aquibacillus koreensis]MCT2537642.1 penicillin-binding protein 2 [Aquibacillus koreensis]MDC3419088.1 penicillin-binding protein 2 [Aquibacillus koreensis]